MMSQKRIDGRNYDDLRPVKFTPGYVIYPEGSVLIEIGNTKVICNVTIEAGAPRWKTRQNIPGGWVTGEYALMPRATTERTRRETNGLGGRTQEIRRLIGRSLRAAVDLEKLGETLFKRWFVDFEFPDENGLSYKCNQGAMKDSPNILVQ